MKKSSWVIVGLLVVIGAVAVVKLLLGSNASDGSLADSISRDTKNALIAPSPNTPTPQTAKNAEVDSSDEYDPYEDEAFKAQLLEVASVYEETIKYPITSQPIRNAEDARELLPYEESEVDLPFPEGESDKDPIRVSAATDAYQYFSGDIINIRVQISRVPEDEFADVSGVLSGSQGDLPFELEFNASDSTRAVFQASFDTRAAPQNLFSREMLAKLNVTLGARKMFTTVAFRYASASAEVVGPRPSYVDGANLVIPLQLNVYQNGYYFVRGVLEDQTTGQPLIQLQSEARLGQGNAILNLSAHIAALRQQGSEGPYVLRSLRSYRGAEVGESYDAPASNAQARFSIQGFPFSDYADEQYIDEQGQESADFLRDVGEVGVNDEKR